MGKLQHCSTAGKAAGRVQSGTTPLLNRTRYDVMKIYNSFDLGEANRRKLSEILKEFFDNFAIGETNETYESYVFNSSAQKEDESIHEHVGELRTLAQSCNFCTCLHDILIRDRIVLGRGTRKRLFRQGKMTLQKCLEIAKSDEVSNTQLIKHENMDQTTTEDVHKVETTSGDKDKRKRTGRQHANRKPDDDRVFLRDKPCVFCGRNHRKGRTSCAARGRVCGACGKKNHFASQCTAREKNVEVEDDESSEEEYLYCVTTKPAMTETVNSVSEREIYAQRTDAYKRKAREIPH